MSEDSFLIKKCQSESDDKKFGICDEPPPNTAPAYIDEKNGQDWIAVVNNEPRFLVVFTAIDHCISLMRDDGKQDKQCDGVLTFESTIIFVELKNRKPRRNKWVKDGELQLRHTIKQFERTEEAQQYLTKKAYIANSQHPKFKSSQIRRMEQFLEDTGYVLRIENRIIL